MKITLIANSSWYIFNFRSNLIKELVNAGHDVIVVAPLDEYSQRIRDMNVNLIQWNLNSSSLSLLTEPISLLKLLNIIKKIKTDFIFSFTPKANIYSGLSLLLFKNKINFLPNISGLGASKDFNGLLKKILFSIYKLAFMDANKIFFQNQDDLDIFLSHNIIKKSQAIRIPGSGVDLDHFSPKKFNNTKIFLYVGRLLYAKGLIQFINAAKFLKKTNQDIKILVVGAPANNANQGITKDKINLLTEDSDIDYLGVTDDIRSVLENIDLIVLPSFYGEGVPRSLLEAASMGIPIITTDHPGCRDAVDDNETGYLCIPKNEDSLISKMNNFLNLDIDKKIKMGKAARKKMENQFSEQIVLEAYLGFIKKNF